MMNQIVLIGRIVENVEVKELDDKKVASLKLAVQRNYKNADGIYETDFVDIEIWNAIAENTAEYCQKGDLIGVKGRVENRTKKINDLSITYLQVIADRVTFLSSTKPKEDAE